MSTDARHTAHHATARDDRSSRAVAGVGPRAVDLVVLPTSAERGGAERALLDMLAGIRAGEPSLRIVAATVAAGPLDAELARLGVEVVPLHLPGSVAVLGDAALGAVSGAGSAIGRRAALAARLLLAVPATAVYVVRLSRLLRRLRPAVVHSNGLKMHVLSALATPAGSALVWHLHDFLASRPVMARLLRRLAPRARLAIANSRSVAEDAARVWGARPRVVTVYNAVDVERFAAAGPVAPLDELAGVAEAPPGTVRVGLVATLAMWKGHEVFLRALARVAPDVPVRGYVVSGAVYRTAGSEASIDALRTLARELGIADRVAFTGFVPDAAAVMRALDVVVHASTRPEPFGLVIAEAMAAGRAVLVSAAGGASELGTDNEDVVAYPPGDVDALAGHIARVARDGALRARLGARARQTAATRFTRARFAREIREAHALVRGGDVA